MAGQLIPLDGITNVSDALASVGVSVRDGRLLAVVSRSVLDAHAFPGYVLVNGSPATVTTTLHADDVVSVVNGIDRVEATRSIQVAVPLMPAASALYASSIPGSGNAVVGAVSGERVSLVIEQAPTVGPLRAPARLSLTFDDGPHPAYTPRILALIRAANVPVTFCLIGRNALAESSLVREEVAAGASMCDHTQTHPLNLPQLSPPVIASEIRDGATSIEQAAGVSPTYFRAPGGNWSVLVESDARALHLAPLRWTVDPRDWAKPGTQTIIARVLDQLRPDGIVLLHDGGGDRSQTVAALGVLLPELARAGWTFSLPTWAH